MCCSSCGHVRGVGAGQVPWTQVPRPPLRVGGREAADAPPGSGDGGEAGRSGGPRRGRRRLAQPQDWRRRSKDPCSGSLAALLGLTIRAFARGGRSLLATFPGLSLLPIRAAASQVAARSAPTLVPTTPAFGFLWWLFLLFGVTWVMLAVGLWLMCRTSSTRKRSTRTVGCQTSTTFRRHFAVPRMAELRDGEFGTWID